MTRLVNCKWQKANREYATCLSPYSLFATRYSLLNKPDSLHFN